MRFLMGVVWFVVIYFVVCVILGGIAGGMAGANDPAHASEAGRIAGQRIVAGSIVLAAVGTFLGILPGTRPGKKD